MDKPKNLLIDTDVCLDLLTARKPFTDSTKKLFYLAEQKSVNAFVTSVSFSNMFYLISKWENPNSAFEKLSKLRTIVSIAKVGETEIDLSLETRWSDFDDSLQFHSALSHKCEAIISRIQSDYNKSSIPVFNPADFLQTFTFQ